MAKVVFRNGCFADIRTSPKVMAAVNDAIDRVADAAGDGFRAHHTEVTGGRVRSRGAVSTTDLSSIRKNAKYNTLIKALGSGDVK